MKNKMSLYSTHSQFYGEQQRYCLLLYHGCGNRRILYHGIRSLTVSFCSFHTIRCDNNGPIENDNTIRSATIYNIDIICICDTTTDNKYKSIYYLWLRPATIDNNPFGRVVSHSRMLIIINCPYGLIALAVAIVTALPNSRKRTCRSPFVMTSARFAEPPSSHLRKWTPPLSVDQLPCRSGTTMAVTVTTFLSVVLVSYVTVPGALAFSSLLTEPSCVDDLKLRCADARTAALSELDILECIQFYEVNLLIRQPLNYTTYRLK